MKSYFLGVAWFILSLISSAINDVIGKYLGTRLHSYEITFFRFLFSTLTLVPFIIYNGFSILNTTRPILHFTRGLLLFLGIAGWVHGLNVAPITTATIVSFMIPVFVLMLSVFFLKEKVMWQRWIVTIIAFIGLVITLSPNADSFNPQTVIFIFAGILFAILDILNKRFVIKESMISMLFYSAIITAFLALPFALQYWITPTQHELFLLLILGSSANLILFFILKAFTLADVTALAPYRYIELIFAGCFAYIIFGDIPHSTTILGAIIIAPSTLFIIYSERKSLNKEV